MSVLTGSLSTGIFCLYVVPPFTLLGLWLGSRRLAELEAGKLDRARDAGEAL
jgi:hypothetical protein